METWKIVLIVVAAVGLIAAAPVLLGLLLPKKYTGKKYLMEALRKRGIDIRPLPDEFYDACTKHASTMARFAKVTGESGLQAFASTLDMYAEFAELWIVNPDAKIFTGTDGAFYRQIFEKHEFRRVA